MKKNAFIVSIMIQLAIISPCAQVTESIKKNKSLRFCEVKVTLMNDSVDRYALQGFSNDSMFVFPLDEEGDKKVIQLDKQTSINAGAIKKIYIKIDRQITLPQTTDQVEYATASDSFARKVKHVNTGQEMTNFVYDQLIVFPGDPLTGVASLGLGLLFGPNGKVYYIKGNERKFANMVKELTRAKKRSVENKIPEN